MREIPAAAASRALAAREAAPMRETLRTPQCAVFDDVLAPAAFAEAWHLLQAQEYQPVHAQGWRKSWWLLDGAVFTGPTHFSRHPEGMRNFDGAVYPTGTAMDFVLEAVRAAAQACTGLVGEEGREWSVFSARSYLYPQGSGLSWHQDGLYAGAYIYYAHRQWNAHWGGELLIADESCDGWEPAPQRLRGAPGPVRLPACLDNEAQSEMLMTSGHGRYILPRPNRLVVLRPNVFHSILPVRPSAGDHARCSVTGFFQHVVPIPDAPTAA